MPVFHSVEEMQQDLDKRLVTFVEKAAARVASGEWSQRDFAIAAKTLNESLRFHMPQDTVDLLDAALEQKIVVRDFNLLNNGDTTIAIGIVGNLFVVCKNADVTATIITDRYGDPSAAEARVKLMQAFDKLTNGKWKVGPLRKDIKR